MSKDPVKDFSQDSSLKGDLSANSSMINDNFQESDSVDTAPINTAMPLVDSMKYEGQNEVDSRPIVTGGIVRTGASPTRLQLSQISPDAPNFDGGEEDPALYVLQDGGVRMYLNANVLAFFTPIGSPSAGAASGSIYGSGTNQLYIDVGDEKYIFDEDFYPESDGVADLGRSGNRWNTVYANFFSLSSISADTMNYTQTATTGLAADFTLTPVTSYHTLAAAAARTSSVTTAINNGSTAGQMLILQGTSDVNTITIKDGANTALSADCVLGNQDTLSLIWDGADWVETARSNN